MYLDMDVCYMVVCLLLILSIDGDGLNFCCYGKIEYVFEFFYYMKYCI